MARHKLGPSAADRRRSRKIREANKAKQTGTKATHIQSVNWIRPDNSMKLFKLSVRTIETPNKGFKTFYAGGIMPLDAAYAVAHLKKQRDFDEIAEDKLELAQLSGGKFAVCLVKYQNPSGVSYNVIEGTQFNVQTDKKILYVILDENNKLVDMPVSVYRKCPDMMHDLYQTNPEACKAFGLVRADENKTPPRKVPEWDDPVQWGSWPFGDMRVTEAECQNQPKQTWPAENPFKDCYTYEPSLCDYPPTSPIQSPFFDD